LPSSHTPPVLDGTLGLALAVVAASTAPLLLLDDTLKVVGASHSFLETFGLAADRVTGCQFTELGTGEWNVRQLRHLLAATASGMAEVEAYELEIRIGNRRTPRCLIINAHRLDYGDPSQVRLLVAIADVTEARAQSRLKDDLLREKAILLQEIQHRVANSLQIIASVILQSARKSQSEETRANLTDAHSRVMSVAALQHQLATSRIGDVELKPYFTQVCRSIAASMIHDPDQLSLVVECDESTVPAETSVSLGLIITELVINALKHGFPGGRKGRITVAFQSTDQSWSLAIRDDGVGMPKGERKATPGLGTSIVDALASQLKAQIEVTDGQPGTTITIVHSPVSDSKAGQRAL